MGKKKGGKAGSSKKGVEVKKEDAFVPRLYPGERDNWMVIEFKLINWKFMNFKMKLREETRMFTIKDIIRERHGKIEGNLLPTTEIMTLSTNSCFIIGRMTTFTN